MDSVEYRAEVSLAINVQTRLRARPMWRLLENISCEATLWGHLTMTIVAIVITVHVFDTLIDPHI